MPSSYSEYSEDADFIREYDKYQTYKYKKMPSERDRKTLALLQEYAPKAKEIIDYACSTGNFLRYISQNLTDTNLVGVDLASASIDSAKADPELVNIEFIQDDMLAFTSEKLFDAANATAVFSLFTDEEVKEALSAIRANLKTGGLLIGFEWLSPWSLQRLEITETSLWHPKGLKITMRPKAAWRELLQDAGYATVDFYDFEMPFDLEKGSHDEDVVTYTEKTLNGKRLSFRGALYQPWCHYVAVAN